MILNNLFLFILPLPRLQKCFCLFWTRHTEPSGIDRFEMGRECPLLDGSAHGVVYVLTLLLFFQRRQSMRLSMDINRRGSRSARFFRRSTLNVKKRRSSTSWCNGTIFNGTTKRQTEKGQKRFVYSWAASWHIVEHIKNRFCTVNWTQIYLILNESRNIVPGPFVCASSAFVADYSYVVITLKTNSDLNFALETIHHHPISFSPFYHPSSALRSRTFSF